MPVGIIYTVLPNLARVYHACMANRAMAARLTACRTPRASDHGYRKYYLFQAIFFLTVINVLLYSKYPMALDHYGRTVGKRLSGGLSCVSR